MLTVAPTSAGKSIMIISDADRQLKSKKDSVIVIVSPKILLTQQLSLEFQKFIQSTDIIHTHSGDTEHKRITDFLELAYYCEVNPGPKVIFTTYHSLNKIVKSEIDVDVVYLDEAHHAVNTRFFDDVKALSETSTRFYSLTATPRYSQSLTRPGNNNTEVFGEKVYTVKAPELIQKGYILPPVAMTIPIEATRNKEDAWERDFYTLCDTIFNEEDMNKVLVVEQNTKVMNKMIYETSFLEEMKEKEYEVLWITSKYGAFVNGKKVCRSYFLDTLSKYGEDPNKKFVVLHIGILTEGISVPGIQTCIFMRQQNFVSTVQTIGRAIRVNPDDAKRIKSGELVPGDFDNYVKPYGKIVIPTYSNRVGIATSKRVNSVVNDVFVEGNFVVDYVK